MKKVLITGGTGLVGNHLTKLLIKKGYKVRHLSRKKQSDSEIETFVWNIEKGFIDPEAFKEVDSIIHLAGANVSSKRWTDKRKKTLVESRTKSTELLFNKAQEHNIELKCFISASGINYYGTKTSDHTFIETDSFGQDFLAQCTIDWEKSVDRFSSICRVAKLRIGVVLAKEGGAYPRLSKPIKLFVGSPIGKGNQFIPWIHIDDLCNLFLYALENPTIDGTFNAIADEHVTNKEFTKIIAKKLNRPIMFPNIPSFVLKLIFGEMAEIILCGSKASNEKIKKEGFQFRYSKLDDALSEIINQ